MRGDPKAVTLHSKDIGEAFRTVVTNDGTQVIAAFNAALNNYLNKLRT